jgi:hypothetical protein
VGAEQAPAALGHDALRVDPAACSWRSGVSHNALVAMTTTEAFCCSPSAPKAVPIPVSAAACG